MNKIKGIQNKLFSLRNCEFKNFNAKLIPNIDSDTVIGIRTPALRSLAKEMIKRGEENEFIYTLPHKYFEENQLHAFIIGEIKDYERALIEVERFLPYIDNWATCDQLSVKAFANNPEKLLIKTEEWLRSNKTYTVRFGIGIFMRYFLDTRFKEEYLHKIAEIKSSEYYINMMIAWYFATALAKQYEATLPIFTEKKLDVWVHNKAISKARESFIVSEEHKEYLKTLKIK